MCATTHAPDVSAHAPKVGQETPGHFLGFFFKRARNHPPTVFFFSGCFSFLGAGALGQGQPAKTQPSLGPRVKALRPYRGLRA